MKKLEGRIGVGLVFVDGARSEDRFTDSEYERVLEEIRSGLAWVREYNRETHLDWYLDIQRVQVDVEDSPAGSPAIPINDWAVPALNQLGALGDGGTAAGEYVEKLRRRMGLSTAFVAYVGKFHSSRGRNSGARLGNIALWIRQAHRDDQSWVFPHEVLHLFGAPDEYRGGGGCDSNSCNDTFGEFRVRNGNCSACTTTQQVPCLMRSSNVMELCKYSVAHVGWDDPNLMPEKPVAAREGEMYALVTGGRLMSATHTGWQSGEDRWEAADEIGGAGWGDYKQIHAGGQGVVYGTGHGPGPLRWHRHLGNDSWSHDHVRRLGGAGWHRLAAVGFNGAMYNINPNRGLQWYRHLQPLTGSDAWQQWAETIVGGSGWPRYRSIHTDRTGVVYAVDDNAGLLHYRHVGWRVGSDVWDRNGDSTTITPAGWTDYVSVIAAGRGVIYGELPDGRLHWYRLNGWEDGRNSWANNGQPRTLSPPWT